MLRSSLIVAVSACAVVTFALPAAAQWVQFVEQSSRMVSEPALGRSDVMEKDYAWGDFDQDGDTDLVCVRKTPFSQAGRQANVLFMNEGVAQGHALDGVLVDRTDQFASAADDGGEGMNDLTDDRDVVALDVNQDGWLDIVTATTYGAGLPKTISHPRVYINLRESAGMWLGFRYEQNRTPQLGNFPNFCGVGAGDVTGDKAPDLYFVDYDRLFPTSTHDDRLLINDGNGFFSDQSATRMTAAMLTSSFGTTAWIADMNGDGKLDIVKSEDGPVKTMLNNGGGFFTTMQATYQGSAYFSSVGDLNGDGKIDIVITDDGTDRYFLNTTPSGAVQPTFSTFTFPNSGGFGSSSRYADFNNDGFTDVVICDVDVDTSECDRVTKIYRNLGNLPNVTLTEQGAGGIPLAMRQGVYDVAPIDLNRDGWTDLVVGRCLSTEIWMNVPPSGLVFAYPQGLPGFIESDTPHNFEVQINVVGGGTVAPNTATLHYAINGGSFTATLMTSLGGGLYGASLPAVQCTDIIRFYASAQMQDGPTFLDPPGAPANSYEAVAADGTQITVEDTIEGDVSGWQISAHASLTGGAWQQADPNGTVNVGQLAAPENDAGNGADVKAFVTQDGAPGAPPQVADVDGGPTWLVSPTIDLAGTDATISYDRWFYCEDAGTSSADLLHVEISNNNGAAWVPVHTTGGTNSAWENVNFRVGEFVTPSAQVRVRFWTQDSPNDSITEAGIDNLTVEELVCGPACAADIAPAGGDGVVNVNDLLLVVGNWGATVPPANAADVNGDLVVNVNDLLAVVGAWGPCP